MEILKFSSLTPTAHSLSMHPTLETTPLVNEHTRETQKQENTIDFAFLRDQLTEKCEEWTERDQGSPTGMVPESRWDPWLNCGTAKGVTDQPPCMGGGEGGG